MFVCIPPPRSMSGWGWGRQANKTSSQSSRLCIHTAVLCICRRRCRRRRSHNLRPLSPSPAPWPLPLRRRASFNVSKSITYRRTDRIAANGSVRQMIETADCASDRIEWSSYASDSCIHSFYLVMLAVMQIMVFVFLLTALTGALYSYLTFAAMLVRNKSIGQPFE